MRALLLLGSTCGLLLLGCPPAEKKDAPAEKAGCTKIGQTCEYSPGKLGTCVTKDGCSEPTPACFVCQSQH